MLGPGPKAFGIGYRHKDGQALEVSALIVAGGRGKRAQRGDGQPPKQYRDLCGQSILARALQPFLDHPRISNVLTVIGSEDRALYTSAVGRLPAGLSDPVLGGETRQASVAAGLEALTMAKPDFVLIHDAARPFVTGELIDRVIDGIVELGSVIPAVPVADTLKRAGADGHLLDTVSRDGLYHAQTPQGFRFSEILAAHRRAKDKGWKDLTDDAAVAEASGIRVCLVAGDRRNLKITSAEDIDLAEQSLRAQKAARLPDVRVGNGFDVHRLVAGDHVWLCGVRIPHTHGLEGHSDADVGLHAVTDALFGALAEGDIGTHFPPTDATWKGAASHIFLKHAADMVHSRDGIVSHVDITLVCEAPRIGPHVASMRSAVAEILDIAPQRVSVKATTSEGLGFAGRREGIAALATATVCFSPVE